MLTVDDQISVRQIAKTFASGRAAERLVYSTLSDCGLPSGKVSIYVKRWGSKASLMTATAVVNVSNTFSTFFYCICIVVMY